VSTVVSDGGSEAVAAGAGCLHSTRRASSVACLSRFFLRFSLARLGRLGALCEKIVGTAFGFSLRL